MFKRISTLLLVIGIIVISCSKNNPTGPAKTAPVIKTQPSYQTSASVGNPCSFSVAATGNPMPTYQWQHSIDGGTTWQDISLATDSIYTIQFVALGDSGVYRAVVSNSQGAVNSNSASLWIAPLITTQPLSETVDSGGSVTFHAVAAGYPAPIYEWQKDGYDISYGMGADLTIDNVTADSAVGSFWVIVTNLAGSVCSDTVTLTVN
jgi:hypothetical protein